MEARNHYETQYDSNRIALVRLMIILLSQPLFHAPDVYLVILNPFSTYLTNRRCKNVKNLFVSLVNFVVSYDCAGYVSLDFCSHFISSDMVGIYHAIISNNIQLKVLVLMIEYGPLRH